MNNFEILSFFGRSNKNSIRDRNNKKRSLSSVSSFNPSLHPLINETKAVYLTFQILKHFAAVRQEFPSCGVDESE